MALAILVSPFIVAQGAVDGDTLAFLHGQRDALCRLVPCHHGEPLRVFYLFVVGVATRLVHGEVEARDDAVVVEGSWGVGSQ